MIQPYRLPTQQDTEERVKKLIEEKADRPRESNK